jgi:hypothetical protein
MTPGIMTAVRLHKIIEHSDYHHDTIRHFLIYHARALGLPIPAETGREVLARIEMGRWIVDCPCRGAEAVDSSDPIFMCLSCGDGIHTVIFPDNRGEIEEELLKRENVKGWSWYPQETIEELRAETQRL